MNQMFLLSEAEPHEERICQVYKVTLKKDLDSLRRFEYFSLFALAMLTFEMHISSYEEFLLASLPFLFPP